MTFPLMVVGVALVNLSLVIAFLPSRERRGVAEWLLRRIARRPHPDYARIRLQERELGMEPSEPLMPVAVLEPRKPKRGDLSGDRRAMRALAAQVAAQAKTQKRCQQHHFTGSVYESGPAALAGTGSLRATTIRLTVPVLWCDEHMCPVDDPPCDCGKAER